MNFARSFLTLNQLKLGKSFSSSRLSRLLLSTTVRQASEEKKPDKMDQFKSNPYYSKYESKLKNVYEQNPGLFESKFVKKSPEKTSPDVKGSKMAYSMTQKRQLESIMKTNMLDGHGRDDIRKIWVTYMTERSRLPDILSNQDYEFIIQRSEKFKTFLFPLPRENSGYEFMVCQWSNNECHLTPLINFQAYGENAPTAMSLVFFDELVRERNLDMVLVMGEWDEKVLKRDEAKLLMEQIKLYYLNRDESDDKFKLMSGFSERPDEFKHMDLIKQWEVEKKKGFGELD